VRIKVAGSIRRRRRDVGDIEIVCVPRIHKGKDLFQGPGQEYDFLDDRVKALMNLGVLKKRNGYGPENKYLVHVRSGIPVDVFSANERNWGMTLLVRTGPAEFSAAVMTRLKQLGHQGHVTRGITLHAYDPRKRKELACPDEMTVFQVLDLGYIEPRFRDATQIWQSDQRTSASSP